MIRRLHIRNFKSFKEQEVTLGRRNVLVGPNLAGKSNLLGVFRFLNRMVSPDPGSLGLGRAVREMGGFPELVWRGGESDVVGLGFDAEENGATWEYRLEFAGSARSPLVVQDESLTIKTSGGSRRLVARDQATGRRVIHDSTGRTISEIHDVARSALEFELPDWEGNRLRRYLFLFTFYALVPEMMRQVNPIGAPYFLSESGENLSAWLLPLQTVHQDTFERVRRCMVEAFPEMTSVLTVPTQQSTVFLAAAEKHLHGSTPVWQWSAGALCFLALASLLFTPPERAASLYCIEEPESHLHPRLIELLIGFWQQRSQEPNSPQIIATTHSPTLVDHLRPEDLIVVDRRDGATILSRPEGKEHLLELLAEAGLGGLYYSGALGGA